MTSESKEVDAQTTEEAAKEAVAEVAKVAEDDANVETNDSEEEDTPENEQDTNVVAESSKNKKKKSKKAKFKKLLGGGGNDAESSSTPANKLTPSMVDQLLEMNPSLKGEVADMDKLTAVEALKKLDVADLLTGMAVTGKNQKDMASYKFWQTQPVPRFDEKSNVEEGQIKPVDLDKVPKEPRALHGEFEWVTMDLNDEKELNEVHDLLLGHYVEDDESMFRLNYSASFLNWALKAPGWRKDWHVGVRAIKSRKLVAFISAIPVDLRIRSNVVKCSEVNFLCIHKKLRSLRLAPQLIAEITRRCNIVGVFQAIYTAGTVLPTPVSSCRYYHRPLDWLKLYEVGFSGLPHNSTKARQVAKNFVPTSTALDGLRPMRKDDVNGVRDLLNRYLKRFAMGPEYTDEEFEHWFVHNEEICPEQVVWTYVVEDSTSHKITDFTSFFCLESLIVNSTKHKNVRAAYSFYYASDAAFEAGEKKLKERLNAVMLDSLVLAKKANFDVFNALTLLDNPLFLEQQKFGAGDGQLYYYLFNYRTAPIPGGIDAKNKPDEKQRGGVGMVML